ncbi:MAG: ABC transporter ATP-binding protein [Candidatus Binatia bacterium]
MTESFLQLRDVTKTFSATTAVERVFLEIRKGEFFTLLGPSGCGKTTTLRILAGLEEPDQGEIYLDGEPLTVASRGLHVPPEKRKMGLVPQSYAVWPHLSVFENVAYPLKLRRWKETEMRQQVRQQLALVGLAGLEDRSATLLSGGQQQRVAMARALVYSPVVLLMDEPLSNLDAKLRDQMREELKTLQRKTGVTVIFVTHDQTEAMSLSDRIAVMSSGRVEQVGAPEEVYDRPLTPFVRDFLGTNFVLHGRFVAREGCNALRLEIPSPEGSSAVVASAQGARVGEVEAGAPVAVCVRPEHVTLTSRSGESNSIAGIVESLLFVGDRYECRVSIGPDRLLVHVPRSQKPEVGEKVYLNLPKEGLTVWPR